MAGADEPATLSGFCQPMAMAMVSVFATSIQGQQRRLRGSESASFGGGEGLRGTGTLTLGGSRWIIWGGVGGSTCLEGGPRVRVEPARSPPGAHPGNASGTPSERPLDAQALGRCELHCISPGVHALPHRARYRWCRRGHEGWRREGGLGAALMRSRNTGCTARVTPVGASPHPDRGRQCGLGPSQRGLVCREVRERSICDSSHGGKVSDYAPRCCVCSPYCKGGGECIHTGWDESGGKKRKGSAQWGAQCAPGDWLRSVTLRDASVGSPPRLQALCTHTHTTQHTRQKATSAGCSMYRHPDAAEPAH